MDVHSIEEGEVPLWSGLQKSLKNAQFGVSFIIILY